MDKETTVSLKDLYLSLKRLKDSYPEFLERTSLLMQVKTEDGIVRSYPIKQIAIISEGSLPPKYCIKNYREVEFLREEPSEPSFDWNEVLKSIKGEEKMTKKTADFFRRPNTVEEWIRDKQVECLSREYEK
jgi:hypothetical protein